jgi:hypothetical protein
MNVDMRHMVIFRVPQSQWERDQPGSSTLDDWLEEHTYERPVPVLGDTDFRFHYAGVCFVAESEAREFSRFLRGLPGVELAFDLQGELSR